MVADRRESVALVSPHRATFRKVVSLFFSAGVGQLLSPGTPPPWKRLKAILRPNVLEICVWGLHTRLSG